MISYWIKTVNWSHFNINLYDSLIDDQNASVEDAYLDILNDIHGHLDFSQMCKYHDLTAYDKISTDSDAKQLNIIHINSCNLKNKIDSISATLQTI